MYRCTQDSPCTRFFLHKTCANLPMMIQHYNDPQHLLTLIKPSSIHENCRFCEYNLTGQRFVYMCNSQCGFGVCCKCALPELELNHPSHNHTLTFMPMLTLHTCTACGMEGRKNFSYLCKTCLFWIHMSCAYAPANLILKDHHNGHPLVLAYSLPEEYLRFGVSCSLCPEMVYPCYWLYYCAECRYFAHVHCASSAARYVFITLYLLCLSFDSLEYQPNTLF